MIPSLQDEALVIQPSRDAATSWDHMPLACTTEATGSKASKHAGGPLVLVDSFYTRIANYATEIVSMRMQGHEN